MMSNRQTDLLFQLISTMEKSEKRYFKLYIKQNKGKEELKMVRLFDALDKMPDYDEKTLLKKLPDVERHQLGNLKAHLYKQLMASLRDLKSKDSVELQLNELLDYGRILYNKGLFQQSIRFLEKAKEIGFAHGKYNFLSQVISLEKKIEGMFTTNKMAERAKLLAEEALVVSGHIYAVFRLSNLALQLYGYYTQHGHARNAREEKEIETYFHENLPSKLDALDGFYEKLYLYQSYCWYHFIRQDFLHYYKYASKWVALFTNEPVRIKVETGHYIRGMHSLLTAHFDLRNFNGFEKTLKEFEEFYHTPLCQQHNSFKVQTLAFITNGRLNWHLMVGAFKEGLMQVPIIEENVRKNEDFIDHYRKVVFNYKIASLHFGYGDYKSSLDYLQKIIQESGDLRYDLQCYARLMHLLCHYELGNDMLIESLTKSVYRYMTKMQRLSKLETEVLAFLRKNLSLSPRKMKPEFEKLLLQIKQYESSRTETRSFAYLDIISYLESKVKGVAMGRILQEKYLNSKRK